MKATITAFAAALLLFAPLTAMAQPAPAPTQLEPAVSPADAYYLELVKSAKADLDSVDFAEMRTAYAASSFYKGYDSDPSNYAVPGVEISADVARTYVDENFALLGSHIIATMLFAQPKGSPEWIAHAEAFKRVLDTIAASGNGKGPGTAFQVLVVSEEYDFMRSLKVQYTSQRLVTEGDRSYDVFSATLPGRDKPVDLWFDVTTLIGHN